MNILFTPNQQVVFVVMLFLGCAEGVLFDLFKIKRMIFGNSSLLLFFDDVFFSVFSVINFIVIVFAFNYGIVRWYEFFACFIGFVVYRKTISKLLLILLEFIICKFKKLLNKLLSLIIFPLKTVIIIFKRFETLIARRKSKFSMLKFIRKI